MLGLGLLFALIAFLPDLLPTQASGLVSQRAHAVIVDIQPATDQSGPTATVRILDGEYAGQSGPAVVEGPSGSLQLPDYAAGDEVVLAIDQNPDGTQSLAVVDRWRLPILEWLVVGFALVTIAIGGWRGLRALTSLAITLVLVVRVLIPLLLAGWNPVALAIGLGIAITILSFLLTQGISRATLAAVLGTAGGLAVTGILAVVVAELAQFTTAQGSQEIITLQQLGNGQIDLSGLLLAAVIFGALGVLNDVAISQAVTVDELRELDPTLGRTSLYTRTMRIGVAHLAANVNTLLVRVPRGGPPTPCPDIPPGWQPRSGNQRGIHRGGDRPHDRWGHGHPCRRPADDGARGVAGGTARDNLGRSSLDPRRRSGSSPASVELDRRGWSCRPRRPGPGTRACRPAGHRRRANPPRSGPG